MKANTLSSHEQAWREIVAPCVIYAPHIPFGYEWITDAIKRNNFKWDVIFFEEHDGTLEEPQFMRVLQMPAPAYVTYVIQPGESRGAPRTPAYDLLAYAVNGPAVAQTLLDLAPGRTTASEVIIAGLQRGLIGLYPAGPCGRAV